MKHRSIYYISVLALCVVSYGVADASPRKKVKIGVESEPAPVETVESLRVAVGNQNVRGEWIIIKASGKEIDTLDERAYLFFSRHDNKLYGYTGCNYINSDYKAEGGKIAFSNIIISQRRCDAIRDEASILNALNRAASYEIYKDNRLDLEILDVKDKSSKVFLNTKRHKADVLSGVWSVKSIHGERIDAGKVQLVIDIPEAHLHGSGGCNIINGDIGLDRNKDWFIQFQGITASNKSCGDVDMSLRRELLIALEEVEYIDKQSDSVYSLLDKNKKEVILLNRENIKLPE